MEIWAVGRYDLRLSEQEFWNLTLKQFNALLERHRINFEWQNYRPALICAILANIYRDKKSKAFTPQDFMPKTKLKEKRQTTEEMINIVKLLNKFYKGKVI